MIFFSFIYFNLSVYFKNWFLFKNFAFDAASYLQSNKKLKFSNKCNEVKLQYLAPKYKEWKYKAPENGNNEQVINQWLVKLRTNVEIIIRWKKHVFEWRCGSIWHFYNISTKIFLIYSSSAVNVYETWSWFDFLVSGLENKWTNNEEEEFQTHLHYTWGHIHEQKCKSISSYPFYGLLGVFPQLRFSVYMRDFHRVTFIWADRKPQTILDIFLTCQKNKLDGLKNTYRQ